MLGIALGISGNLSPGCLWLTDGIFRVVLLILDVLNPDTGYFERVGLLLSKLCRGVVSPPGCFGITNAFVCLMSDLSLHKADINGKSIFLLFSRSVRISNAVADLSFCGKKVFSELTTQFTFTVISAKDKLPRFNIEGCFSGMGGGGGGGGSLLNLGGCEDVSREFKILSSDLVRINLPGLFGGKGGGGGSKLPVDEILGAP